MIHFSELLSQYINGSDKSELSIEMEAGISRGFLGKLTRGKRSPTDASVKKLAEYFHLSGDARTAFVAAAKEAKARRQSRAVPVLESLEKRAELLEKSLKSTGARVEFLQAFSLRVVNHLAKGKQRSELLDILADGAGGDIRKAQAALVAMFGGGDE